MSELREALNWLVHLHHGVSRGHNINPETGEQEPMAVTDDEWEECLAKCKEALDAPSDMDKLVADLRRFNKQEPHSTNRWGFETAIGWIKATYGCGEDE